ncbi:copper amine oxidase N-terminal domain-containing protein [Fusibacter bizertensis]
MKKIMLFPILLILLISSTVTYATSEITLYVDGNKLILDQSPFISDGRTLVPVAAICNSLKMDIQWDSKTRTVKAYNDTFQIKLVLEDKLAIVNGNEFELDVPAMSIGGRTMVPVSFIANAIGAEVSWDSENRIINIKTTNISSDNAANEELLKHTKTIPAHDSVLFYKDQEFVDLLRTKYDVINLYGDGVVRNGDIPELKLNIYDQTYFTINNEKISFYNAIELYDPNGSFEAGTNFLLGMKYYDVNTLHFNFKRYDERQFPLVNLILEELIDKSDAKLITDTIQAKLKSYLNTDKLYNDKVDELKNYVQYINGYKITYSVSLAKINNEVIKSVVSFTIE